MIMKSKLLIAIGTVMILSGLGLTGFNLYQDKYAKNMSEKIKEEIKETIQNTESEWKDTYQEVTITEMPIVEIDGHYYVGTLDIPKLELSLPIMSESSVSNLLISPCRYYGSVYTNDMVIAAHNYYSHFARLNQLKEHDVIIFTDMDGNVFEYEVVGLEVLQPTQVEEMTKSEFDLTLYTCTYGGETRLTVRCIKKSA